MDNNKEKKDKKTPLDESHVPHVRKGVAITAICLFMAVLLLPSAVWGGLMIANLFDGNVMATFNPQTSEHLAAKTYAEFPKTFNPDTFTVEVEAWYNDHLPFRSILFNANESIMSKLEKPYEEDLRPVLITMFNKNNNQQQAPSLDNSGNEEIFTERVEIEETETEYVVETETLPTIETETLPPIIEDETEPIEEETLPPEEFNPGASLDCEHEFDSGVVDQEASCTNKERTKYTCSKCGYARYAFTNAALGHYIQEGVVLLEQSCTELGKLGNKCTRCDYEKQTAWIPKHTRVQVSIPPTCTEIGFEGEKCSVCNEPVSGESFQVLGHDYVSNITSRPLCGTSYEEIKTCTRCQDSSTTQKLSQHSKGKVVKTVEATSETYGYTLVNCKYCGGQYRTEIKNRLGDDPAFMQYTRVTNKVIEGRYRWLFYLGDNSEAYYKGTNVLSDADLQDYVAVLTELNELCKKQGKTLQISIWPNKNQVYPEFTGYDVKYTSDGKIDNSYKRVYKWTNYVKENTDIKIVYPLEELQAARPYFDVYCKYDTHWNTTGGFIGYQAMLESLGLETMNINDCPVFEYTGGSKFASDHYYTQLRGDLFGMGWSFNAADYPDHRNYYVKYRPEVSAKFINGTNGKNGAGDIRHTTASNATYDTNFVMLADSYRVMQLGYLEKDFSDCYLCHRNQVNEASTRTALKNADIIVIAAVERYDANIIVTAQDIINILSAN